MGTINQDNTYFNNVAFGSTQIGLAAPGKYINIDNLYEGTYDPLEGEVAMSLNAIEIDWNGAQLPDYGTLNSTGDVINLINNLLNRIKVLENKLGL